jgi:Family of unknown function (DUF6184)
MRVLVTTASLLAVLVAAAAGCGDSSHSQGAARDEATTASCAWEAMCADIGPGKTYASTDSCLVQVRARWDNAWPVTDCDGKISPDQLAICVDAIHATQCANGLDILTTLTVKCSKASICSGP